jgi:hypothetical protein
MSEVKILNKKWLINLAADLWNLSDIYIGEKTDTHSSAVIFINK